MAGDIHEPTSYVGQAIGGAIFGFAAVGSLLKVLWEAFKPGGKSESESPRHVILETAQLADMDPVRVIGTRLQELYGALVPMGADLKRIVEMLERQKADDDLRKKIQDAIESREARERVARDG